MKKITLSIFAALCATIASAQWNIPYSLAPQMSTDSQLEQHFRAPQAESRIHSFWWWLNSLATKSSITRDLEQMKAKGYGGCTLFDAGSSDYGEYYKDKLGPRFMSPEWMELYCHAVKEADRLDLELSINLQSGWNPGAPCVTPKDAAKKLTHSQVEVKGPASIEIQLPMPSSKLLYEDIAVQAHKIKEGTNTKNPFRYFPQKAYYDRMGWKGTYPLHNLEEDTPQQPSDAVINISELVELTANVDDKGVLRWNVPAGRWNIIRYGMTCTGMETSTSSANWKGLSYDHLSSEAFRLFADSIILPLVNSAKQVGNSLRYLHTDSWEMGVVNWTPNFMEEFKILRGYDMKPLLPVMTGKIVESKELSNRFLRDMRRTVADLVYRNHYKLMSDLAHDHGIGIHPESGGPHSAPVDGLEMMGLSDIPTGEFWATANTHRILDDERLAIRQAASAAHTHSKRLVQAEGPTSIGPHWERAPRDLKSNLDRVFCTGVNRILWHTYTSSPQEFGTPGIEYFAGTHMNANTTWWPYADSFVEYMNRCSQMLSEGLFHADVAYYYGDNAPNYVFIREDKELSDLPFGYDYDKVSKNVLMDRAYVKDGRLTLPDGMNYKVLMLPKSKYLDPALLLKIETWINQGLIVLGERPTFASSGYSAQTQDANLAKTAERLWGSSQTKGERKIGKGKLFSGVTIDEVLKNEGIGTDFGFRSESPKTRLDFIHRYTNTADIYFVSNPFAYDSVSDYKYRYVTELPDRYETVECKFRVKGRQPELWDAVTGEMRKVVNYREQDGFTYVPITLNPEGSVFVIFRNQSGVLPKVSFDGVKSNVESYASVVTQKPLAYVANDKLIVEAVDKTRCRVKYINGRDKIVEINDKQHVRPVEGVWSVAFDTKWGGPASVEMPQLKAWNEYDRDDIRYYSGSATYKLNLAISKDEIQRGAIYLDMGNLLEMARVRLNGREVAVSWQPPHLVDITEYVKRGDNALEIDVVNMWVNRLVGDAKLPADKRYTQTNITKFDKADDSSLRRSGLIGPVQIISRPRVLIDL